jgi:hypothetical protein
VDRARLADRLAVRFMFELMQTRRQEDSLLDLLLLAAIVHANVEHLGRDPRLDAAYARLDATPPDPARRPVSINALAASLHQPFETARRRIGRLIAHGLVAQAAAGVYVPAEVIRSAGFVAAAQHRYDLFWALYEDARRLGLVEPMAAPPPAADDPRAPVRAVDRIVMDYAFRTLELVQRSVRDPLTALVLIGLIRGTAPVRQAELARRVGVPYETTRRHVGWLLEHGLCRRQSGGVAHVGQDVPGAEESDCSQANLAALTRTLRRAAALTTALGGAPQPAGQA